MLNMAIKKQIPFDTTLKAFNLQNGSYTNNTFLIATFIKSLNITHVTVIIIMSVSSDLPGTFWRDPLVVKVNSIRHRTHGGFHTGGLIQGC